MSTNEELKKNAKKKKCLGLKSRWLEEKKVEENKSCLRVIHCERGIERKIVSQKINSVLKATLPAHTKSRTSWHGQQRGVERESARRSSLTE